MAKKKPTNTETKVWVTVLKLVGGLTVIIGGVGLALWFAKDLNNGYGPSSNSGWGVSKDSPVRMKR